MNNLIHSDTKIWCGMGGVTAIYNADCHQGKEPPSMTAKSHYFRNCKPDEKMIKALELLKHIYHVNINMITEVQSNLKREQKSDKRTWLKNYMPFIDPTSEYHAVTIPKATYVQKINKKKLSSQDILISDFNQDLQPWAKAGGTAIKYANGINNPHSYHGFVIAETATAKQIVNYIIDIIYKINKGALTNEC